MRRLPAILLLLGFLAMPAGAQDLKEDERLLFAEGLFTRNMFELALKEYDSILKDFPASAKLDTVHFRLGECHRGLKDRVAADREFKAVFTDFPQSNLRLKAGARRADLAVEAGEAAGAVDLFAAVLKENPPPDIGAVCQYGTGEALLKLGRTNEATKAFEVVKAQYTASPFYPYALLKLGQIYSGDPVKAGQVLELYRTVADKPASERLGAEASFQMAELYFRQKDFAKSAEAYRKLLTVYPADTRTAEARLQAAWANHNAGMYAEALLGALDALKVELGDKKAEWMYLKANCERQLLKADDSLQTYADLIALAPEGAFANAARYERALVYYKAGKYKETVDEALKVKLSPEVTKDTYWLLAESYAALKDEANAIQYYRLIVKDHAQSDVACDATYRLAHLLQEKGELKEAGRYYATVAANFPTNKLAPMALFASAFCEFKGGQPEEAIRDWASLAQKYPTDPLAEESFYQKGLAEARLKKDPEAMGSFQDLVKRFPKSKFAADAHYWAGILHKEAGRFKESEDEFRLALQSSPARGLEQDAQFQLGQILQKNGKIDESAMIFQALLASPVQDKFSPTLLEWQAEYKYEKKAYKESLEAATLLAKKAGQDPVLVQTAWGLMGRANLALGDTAKAEEAFRKALEAKAATRFVGEAAFHLGEITLAAKKFEDAGKFYKQAAGLAQDEAQLGVRARAYIGMAQAARGLGDMPNAARYFMGVAVLYDDPELVPECLFEASEAFKLQGQTENRQKAVKELKDRYPDSPWAKKVEP